MDAQRGSEFHLQARGGPGHKLGLVWGGDFKSIYDPGHVQLGELSTATLHHAYTTGSATLAQLLQS